MTIAADRAKYFWLPTDPVTATEPAPATFDSSFVHPCIDMAEYVERLLLALDEVGKDSDPAKNVGDFIFISGWYLGLAEGTYIPASYISNTGNVIVDLTGFDLDPMAAVSPLLALLKKKAQLGVEIRTLAWMQYSLNTQHFFPVPILGYFANNYLAARIAEKNPGDIIRINATSVNSTDSLRKEPRIGANAVLNMLCHSAASVHIKGCLVGTRKGAVSPTSWRAVGFAGGLDFVANRWAKYGHQAEPGWSEQHFWHDVQAAVEGKAAQGLYDAFRDMWNENLRRKPYRFKFEEREHVSYLPGTTEVPKRTVDEPLLSAPAVLTHHVQSLRTIPPFNYRWYNCLPEGDAVSYAPNGLFEVRAAWRKAILGAEDYIYVEDQYFFGREIWEWINTAIRSHADLKVIVLMKSGADPSDPPPGANDAQRLFEALNLGLLGQGDPARQLALAQIGRIRVYQKFGEQREQSDVRKVTAVVPDGADAVLVTFDIQFRGAAIEANSLAKPGNELVSDGVHAWRVIGNPALKDGDALVLRLDTSAFSAPTVGDPVWEVFTEGVFVHAKTTIIDDKWAIIGSANFMRRSLYSDWEYSIAFLDEDETAVRDYRARLWAEHIRVADPTTLHDLDVGLGIWDPSWNPAGDSPPLPARLAVWPAPPYLRPVALPVAPVTMSPDKLEQLHAYVDEVGDVDARQPWGGICPPTKEP